MQEQQIWKAVEALRKGGLVAFPTDTVYGLGADGLNAAAVRRVFDVKRRAEDQPLPLLAADVAMAKAVAAAFPPTTALLAQRFWPGALTIILLKAQSVPDILTGGGRTVGVRVPAHAVPIQLAALLGRPLVGTSANRSGLPSCVTADQVRAQLGRDVDCVVDGVCPGGIESTVVDVTQDPPRIVREGALPIEAIEDVLGVRCFRPETVRSVFKAAHR